MTPVECHSGGGGFSGILRGTLKGTPVPTHGKSLWVTPMGWHPWGGTAGVTPVGHGDKDGVRQPRQGPTVSQRGIWCPPLLGFGFPRDRSTCLAQPLLSPRESPRTRPSHRSPSPAPGGHPGLLGTLECACPLCTGTPWDGDLEGSHRG